jgi:NADH:ubiquinone oxidoreductase subunit 5 (subunit L)/multisubunit Na+/H+ antiporter MnhA subunit
MVNKIGDIALLLAITGCFFVFQSIDFNLIFTLTPYVLNEHLFLANFQIKLITIIAFFMFLGAVGKSAQLGLHT